MEHFAVREGTHLASFQREHRNGVATHGHRLDFISFSSPMDEDDRANVSSTQLVLGKVMSEDC